MPIYIKSRQVQGVNYVFHNGESYKRTGITKPLSATTPLSAQDYTKLYVDSCSGASMGETGVPVGGTTDIDTSTSGEFQLKFEGTNPGDAGELIFRNGSSTCSMILSVNNTGNPVWDATGTGTPSAYEIDKTSLPHTFAYQDCNNNRYEVTLAGLGSFIFRTKRTKLALGKATGVVYSALTATSGKVGSLFTDANSINYDNTGNEALNIGSTDPQNYVSYTIYHTANASVSFDIGNPDAINPATQAPGALSANFTTDVDGSVLAMHIGVSGTPIVYARDTLKCGDRVIGEDADGTEVVLEYRETDASDKVGIDFPTHKSTFYVYRNDLSIKKHNTTCGDDPWVPGPIVPDPVTPIVPGPTPTPTAIPTGPTLILDTTLSGAQPGYWALTGMADNGEDAPYGKSLNVPYTCAQHWHNPPGSVDFIDVTITYSDYDDPGTGEPVQVCFKPMALINDVGEPGVAYYTCHNPGKFSTNNQCLPLTG